MAEKWYPVIDYTACTECGTCVGFCAHGVYDKAKAPVPVVINPAGCIDRCHGCGGLCPQGAITYVGDNTGWVPPHGPAQAEAPACSCGCGTQCKSLTVDFLFLDRDTCERCAASDRELDEAVAELSPVLKTLGYCVTLNKVKIDSPALAEQYRFASSPTIRVNGADICGEVMENRCASCGDLCGADTDCRVFEYAGRQYNSPPKAMIVDGILRALYTPAPAKEEKPYEMPANLVQFYQGIQNNNGCGCSCTDKTGGCCS